MKAKGWDLVPYVNHFGETPDKGWAAYWDSPRYSSGYTTLWSTFSFTPETHMLKPYKQRVASTEDLEKSFIEYTSQHCNDLLQLRAHAKTQQKTQTSFPIAWKLDKTKSTQITFKGYEAGHKASEVSGLPRLYYDRNKPFTKQVPFYNTYVDSISVQKTTAYIIPQGWWKVIERLQANNVQMRKLTKDTSVDVEWYHIDAFQSGNRPYEGHHPNNNVKVSVGRKTMNFRKGDYYIPLNQIANRFLIETLEPQAEDSYFAWNFFDSILGQKEGFSDYVFEDQAAGYLKINSDLKNSLTNKVKADSMFAKNAYAQLNYVYQNSPYFEPAYLQYPVYRVVK